MPSPGSSSSEHFYREHSADLRPGAPAAPRVAAPESANGSEDTRDKDGKLKRTREGCYTCRNRKKKCDQVRPVCGSCSRLSFTCEFPPQIIDANGQLVTVRQPNKRKKDRLLASSTDDQSVEGAEGSLDAKKRAKTHPGPRPGSKAAAQQLSAAAAVAASASGGSDKGKGRDAGSAGFGSSGSSISQQYLDPAGQQHQRSYSNSSGIDQSARLDFLHNGSAGGNGHPLVEDTSSLAESGQSHFLQPRAMSSSSQGSASSGFSLRQSYRPDQLQGSPNLPTSLLSLETQQMPAAVPNPPSNGQRGYPASSDSGAAASIRDRFDHMMAQRGSPMHSAVPNIAFDQHQQQQASHVSIAGTPDLFSRPFSPFAASVGSAGQDPEAHTRVLQEMHRQFQQSFQQPATAPSPSFSEWMKGFGDTMDSPGQIFPDSALKPNGGGGVDASAAKFLVGSQAESPMTWLAPSPAPSSLHLGMSQTPVFQHSHLHPSLQSSPLHQSQTPLHPHPAPTNGSNFDGSRLGVGAATPHFSSASMPPPTQQRTSPSRPSAPASSTLGNPPIAINGQGRPYVPSSQGSTHSHQHVSPPSGPWQPESLDVPNTGYLPSAFIEPIPDEGDSDTRDFVNGYTNGEPSAEGAPGSPIVRAGPNRSVTVTSSLAPTITIKLPELPQMIADQAPLLIDYFVRKLSPLISVLSPRKAAGLAPSASALVGGSDIASVFVPMASQSKLMLLSVLGWSSMHLHELGEPWREIADLLRTQLVERVENAFIAWEERKGPHINDEEMLASLVALSEIEICRGSTSKWYRPLIMARQVIRRIGGADKIRKLNFNTKWLLQNWAYHSLLSSTDCLDGPSLEPEEYAAILCGGLSSFMGPSMIVFQIIAETSRLSVEAAHCIHSDRDKRIEALRVLAAKDARLKARLDAVYPEFPPTEDLTTPETSYHLAAFRCFVLTARLYLRQVVSHCNAHSLVTQLLVNQLLANIGNVIGTPAESSLLFPLFITGVDATTESDRKIIKGHFLIIDNNCRIGNIQAAYSLLEEIWERNDSGERWVDWPKLSRQMGWNVSFA